MEAFYHSIVFIVVSYIKTTQMGGASNQNETYTIV